MNCVLIKMCTHMPEISRFGTLLAFSLCSQIRNGYHFGLKFNNKIQHSVLSLSCFIVVISALQ